VQVVVFKQQINRMAIIPMLTRRFIDQRCTFEVIRWR